MRTIQRLACSTGGSSAGTDRLVRSDVNVEAHLQQLHAEHATLGGWSENKAFYETKGGENVTAE